MFIASNPTWSAKKVNLILLVVHYNTQSLKVKMKSSRAFHCRCRPLRSNYINSIYYLSFFSFSLYLLYFIIHIFLYTLSWCQNYISTFLTYYQSYVLSLLIWINNRLNCFHIQAPHKRRKNHTQLQNVNDFIFESLE